MNYGLVSTPPLKLEGRDEPNRYCIQLYQRVIGANDLHGRLVLEVGSGRGGGAGFVARHYKPQRVIGVDFSPEAVQLAARVHQDLLNLEFRVGDAENLPFGDATFDAVLNVESSHCYGNFAKFTSEVRRVLKPRGKFLFGDLREASGMQELESIFRGTEGFTVLDEEDITADVAAALEADDACKRALISELVPGNLVPLFSQFAGVRGGQVHESLLNRTLVYKRFILERSS